LQVHATGAFGLAHAAREVGASGGVTLRVALVRFLALANFERTRRRAHRGNGGECVAVVLALDLAARGIPLLCIAAGGIAAIGIAAIGIALCGLAMRELALLRFMRGGLTLLRLAMRGLALLRLALLRFAARVVAVVGLLRRRLGVPVALGLLLLTFVLLAFLLVVLAMVGLLRIGLAREGRRRGHAGDEREADGRGEEGVSMQCHASHLCGRRDGWAQ